MSIHRVIVSMLATATVVSVGAWRMHPDAAEAAAAGHVAVADATDVAAPSAPDASAPVLSAIAFSNSPGAAAPKAFKSSDDPQRVAVEGHALTADMSVTVSRPDGMIATYGPKALEQATPTSFAMKTTLDIIGTYGLTVRTKDGARSNELLFDVKK